MKVLKLSPEGVSILNNLLIDEYTAAYSYRHIGNVLKNNGFEKAASYYFSESENEFSHAKTIEDFMVDWNITPTLPSVTPVSFESKSNYVDAINIEYTLESKLYEKYESRASEAMEMQDVCLFNLLNKFVEIQKQSVVEANDMLNKVEGINASSKFELLSIEEIIFGE